MRHKASPFYLKKREAGIGGSKARILVVAA